MLVFLYIICEHVIFLIERQGLLHLTLMLYVDVSKQQLQF